MYPARPQRRRYPRHVVALARVEHAAGQPDGARAGVDVRREGFGCGVELVRGACGGDLADLEAWDAVAQGQPAAGLVRVLGVEDQDVVAWLEGEGALEQIETFRRIAREGDGGGGGRVQVGCQQGAQIFGAGLPGWLWVWGEGGFVEEGVDGGADDEVHGGLEGGVEVGVRLARGVAVGGDRDEGAEVGEVPRWVLG